MKNTNKFWIDFSVNCSILNRESLKLNLKNFWVSIVNNLEDPQVVYIILKVGFTDGTFASFSHLQKVNKTMFDDLLDTLYTYLDLNAENYSDKTINKLIFQYHICLPDAKNIRTNLNRPNKAIKYPSFSFRGYNLPVTTDLTSWGLILLRTDNTFIIKNKSIIYAIVILDNKQIVTVKSKNKVLFEFTDIFGDNTTSFTRILKDKEYIFKDGNLLIKKLTRKTDFITKISPSKKLFNRFLTLDIETKLINNIMVPYCISIFNGKNCNTFYLSDFNNSEEMLMNAITSLLIRSYNNYKVYVHNLSHFDGIFLFRILSNIENSKLTPIMKDGKMITLKFEWKPSVNSFDSYTIEFRDSLLMLPISLKKLAKAFNVDNKGIFPYKFVNQVDLDYIGHVPNFKYFEGISIVDYNNYLANYNKNWNLRKETIKYCELDCKILWKVISIFNENIFNQYNLNIHRFPTLPSLAFGIFRLKYLKDSKIPKIHGQMFQDIRKGYTGGHTDVYVPTPSVKISPGEIVNCYDINSLYPTVMKNYPMPVGNITYFEGNILEIMSNPFGFFECEITTPTNLNRPLLQTKVKTKSGLRTMAPLGKWTDMVFSEEMFEYIKYGYQFKILRGYLFDKEYIFTDYVQDLYQIKENEPKDSPMYLISKLLLNSLYGRFGMDPYLVSNNIINNSDLESFLANTDFNNVECLDLNNGKTLISYQTSDDLFSLDSNANVSISIAAAITAYARINMSEFLADPNLKILYTDTDSIYILGELDPKYIGKGLGLMKLEYSFIECVFLAPKVYGGILENGTELTKVKGFKDAVSYSQMKTLLIKDNKLELNQNKWYRSLSDGTINIQNSLYTLVTTENKRQLVYDNNIFIDTKPFVIDNIKTLLP